MIGNPLRNERLIQQLLWRQKCKNRLELEHRPKECVDSQEEEMEFQSKFSSAHRRPYESCWRYEMLLFCGSRKREREPTYRQKRATMAIRNQMCTNLQYSSKIVASPCARSFSMTPVHKIDFYNSTAPPAQHPPGRSVRRCSKQVRQKTLWIQKSSRSFFVFLGCWNFVRISRRKSVRS